MFQQQALISVFDHGTGHQNTSLRCIYIYGMCKCKWSDKYVTKYIRTPWIYMK